MPREVFKTEYNFNINSYNNKLFNVTIKNLTDFIEIKAFYQEKEIKKEYMKKYRLDELKQIKILSICDTIEKYLKK